MYSIFIRPIVRRMKAAQANYLALQYFKFLGKIPGGRAINRLLHHNKATVLQREVFGLQFYNPLGLGAGLDVRGDLYNDLNDLGFSFSEIGPLDAESTRHAISNIQKDAQDDVLAACIGADYLTSFSLAYDFCDFFVIELHRCDEIGIIDKLLDARLTYDVHKAIIAKIPEETAGAELDRIIDYCMMSGVDGIEARTLAQIEAIHAYSKGRFPIIANCHIKTPAQAEQALNAGADLIEVRSGLVLNGPSFVRKIIKHLENLARNAK